jgi:exopolysaccharide biosynthesis polyprenyl glycosylphosphotransferase
MLRLFRHYFSLQKARLFLLETVSLVFATWAGAWGVSFAFGSGSIGEVPVLPILVWVACYQYAQYLFDLYQLPVAESDSSTMRLWLKATGVAITWMALVSLWSSGLRLPSGFLLGATVGAVSANFVFRRHVKTLSGRPRRLLVVGSPERSQVLVRSLDGGGEGLFDVRGVVSAASLRDRELTLKTMATTLGANEVVWVAAEPATPEARKALDGALLQCRLGGLRVYSGTGYLESALRRIPVEMLEAGWLAFSEDMGKTRRWRIFKRAMDFSLALILAIGALPLALLVALAIRLDSRGPVFYRQERVGRDGKVFRLWKFRSMRTDAEKHGAVWATTQDSRVTRVGRFIRKTRIDEIPQVLNVLAGDMSFVGPRPERPEFVEKIERQVPFYRLREHVKPGMTGWAQIRYPYGASMEDARNKLEFDLYYVKNVSWALDLAIIFHTIRHVLQARGAR